MDPKMQYSPAQICQMAQAYRPKQLLVKQPDIVMDCIAPDE